MKQRSSRLVVLATMAAAFSSALAMTAAFAQPAGALADARAQYERDRAYCHSPQSTQDLPTCLKEAAAAYDEAKWQARGRAESPRALQTPHGPDVVPQRCAELTDEARIVCLGRPAP